MKIIKKNHSNKVLIFLCMVHIIMHLPIKHFNYEKHKFI